MTLRSLTQSFSTCALAVLFLASAAARFARAVDYNESSMPDLSGDPDHPTPLVLQRGANHLVGASGTPDYDIIHITIPTGHTLDSLYLDSFTNGFGTVSFLGLGAGSTWTAGVEFDVDPSHVLGWAHISQTGETGIGHDLLPFMSTAPLTLGFTRPLAAGEYSILLQDYDTSFTYALTFNLSGPIPGDFTGNGAVDGADLDKWKLRYGTATNSDADADGDGDTDGNDFLIWQRNLAVPPAVVAPEPTGVAMIGVVVVGLLRGRRIFERPRAVALSGRIALHHAKFYQPLGNRSVVGATKYIP